MKSMLSRLVNFSFYTFLYNCCASKCSSGFSFSHSPPLRNRYDQEKKSTDIELPNFDALFERIQMASPLAKLVMEGNETNDGGGFKKIDGRTLSPELKWKKIEHDERKTVHQIDKLDIFQNIKTPLLRFRATIKGPCLGELFGNFILDLEERKKWDEHVAHVEELYPIDDLDFINEILDGEKFGRCARIGVGYTRTKAGVISPREQLILGGMQEYKNGSAILWGTEMEEWHNHLLPPGKRHTRSKSHLFAATLVPTGPESFDVEYLLQMDVGGGIPNWMTTPALIDAVKKLFEHAKYFFESGDDELDLFLKSKQQAEHAKIALLKKENEFQEFEIGSSQSSHHAIKDNKSILFTP